MDKYGTGADPYIDPATGVLRNKLGIADEKQLEQVQAMFAARASKAWQDHPAVDTFDLKHLQAIHEYLFRAVFDWAGELRTIDISKGASRFAAAQYIVSGSKPVFSELARERQGLRDANREQFASRAAYYLGEINALHPFREGNGRAQREFISQLARQCGYQIRWTGISQQEMVAASVASMHGDLSYLKLLLLNHLS